ncbi:hypothetical protein [Streptomyces sp. NPDC058240]|uniref:hypothetical protein n=1 Tax=Streptomyces sp. NPDC058240 TaxID=3346396 RepID=UPI0036EEAC75
MLTEALAAAILNHPAFVVAAPDSPCEDTITVQTRNQVGHLLVLNVDGVADGDQDLSSPAIDVAFAADRLLASDERLGTRHGRTPQLRGRHLGQADLPLREHAQAVARSLRTR